MNLTRKDFFEQYRYLFSWYDTDEYACYNVLTVQPELVISIQTAARDVWRVLMEAGAVMKGFDNQTLLDFDYPSETLDVIRATTQPPFIARCDFAVTPEGIYLLECNAEVATFVVETFKMNGIIANHFGWRDVNAEAEDILRRELNRYLQIAADSIEKPLADCHIVFSALSLANEDVGTVEYLRSLCSSCNTSFCAIEQLALDEFGVYDQYACPVDIIYRLYPTEWMVEDEDPQLGVPLWDYLEPLLMDRKVALINPVSSFVLQNKALLALITELWGDRVDHPLSETVHRHFLPTYLDPAQLPTPYVAKPTYGREGKEIEIVLDTGVNRYNQSDEYATLAKVYQKYVDLPTVEIDGNAYTLQYSCFLVNGCPTGVAARIGNTVIGNTSKFLPLGW